MDFLQVQTPHWKEQDACRAAGSTLGDGDQDAAAAARRRHRRRPEGRRVLQGEEAAGHQALGEQDQEEVAAQERHFNRLSTLR